MTGIIAAMDIEAELLFAAVEAPVKENCCGMDFVSGKINDHDVVISVCGIGKVAASMCASVMILRYSPDAVINTGVAGALDPSLRKLDTVVAVSYVQHDMNTEAIGDPRGLISGINMIEFPTDQKLSSRFYDSVRKNGGNAVYGKIATGDVFIATPGKKKFIRDTFGSSACDMEGGALAQVCYVAGVPFAAIRTLSDGADGDSSEDYPAFARKAAAISSKAVIDLFM